MNHNSIESNKRIANDDYKASIAMGAAGVTGALAVLGGAGFLLGKAGKAVSKGVSAGAKGARKGVGNVVEKANNIKYKSLLKESDTLMNNYTKAFNGSVDEAVEATASGKVKDRIKQVRDKAVNSKAGQKIVNSEVGNKIANARAKAYEKGRSVIPKSSKSEGLRDVFNNAGTPQMGGMNFSKGRSKRTDLM